MEQKKVKDHLGHEFKSLASMARAYGKEPDRVRKRINADWDVKRALTTPIKENKFSQPITAPNGITYPNAHEMCKDYHVPYNRFIARLTIRKWPLIDALKSDKYSGAFIPGRDHLGKDYPSQSAMARAWGIPPNCYLTRLEAGWSIKKALTTPVRKRKILKLKPEYDHGLD